MKTVLRLNVENKTAQPLTVLGSSVNTNGCTVHMREFDQADLGWMLAIMAKQERGCFHLVTVKGTAQFEPALALLGHTGRAASNVAWEAAGGLLRLFLLTLKKAPATTKGHLGSGPAI